MKLEKITLILTLIGLLFLTLLAQNKPIQTGTIESIQTSQFKTKITLKENPAELIIFENINLNLKTGNKIKFQGKPDIYKNKKQIIIERLSLIK